MICFPMTRKKEQLKALGKVTFNKVTLSLLKCDIVLSNEWT